MTRFILDPSEKEALLQRFLRYVQVDTQSDDLAECFPTTEKQKDLSRILVEELKTLGCEDARMDPWGQVFATVSGNGPEAPVIGFLAHLDTYPGTPGGGVKPQVVRDYAGGELALPGSGGSLKPEKHPNLPRCLGHTLVHTDGTTLLGADDKAGIAAAMSLIAWLKAHPEFPHGTLRFAFTPDEEVGRGTEKFDVKAFGAAYAYTLDASDLGEVEDETFCADSATVTITGHDVHPGYAKGVMVNAVRVASALVESLPQDRLPETTEGREPYLHPFDLKGDVTQAKVYFLVRAFTVEELKAQEAVLQARVDDLKERFPGASFKVEVKESYRNMAYPIAQDRKVLDHALDAVRRQGIEPVRKAIRGGTDGARLSYMGLLTPNLFAGGQAIHSVEEWVSLEWMAESVGMCIQLVKRWTE